MKNRDLIQTLIIRKTEYQASLDISEDCTSLTAFIKSNYRDHIKFDKEHWQTILEFPVVVVWDILRNNLVCANFSADEVGLIRRKNEALAAEKYLEEYEKT